MSTLPATSTSPLPGSMGTAALTGMPVAVPTAAAPPATTTTPVAGEDPQVTALRNVVDIVNRLVALVAAQNAATSVQGGGGIGPTVPPGAGIVGLNGIIGSPGYASTFDVYNSGFGLGNVIGSPGYASNFDVYGGGSTLSPSPLIGGGFNGVSVHTGAGGTTYVTSPNSTVSG